MLDLLPLVAADPLLTLIDLFSADERPSKIDLGVGVYRDASGQTPVMRAVKAAEHRLLEEQTTKAYVGASGDPVFTSLLADLVIAGAAAPDRFAAVQAPGGTGALRLGADLLARAGAKSILVGRPAWGNHDPIMAAAGIAVTSYRYFDTATQSIVFDEMMAVLNAASPGTVVLLQASCHNPTGADPTEEQWAEIAEMVRRRRLVPFIDVAYQGFGSGVDADLAGARSVIAQASESLVAVSCSKTFGLYRERTGALFAICAPGADRAATLSNMLSISRANYSMPPDHGAAVVRTILESSAMRGMWLQELGEARSRIQSMRAELAVLAERSGLDLPALAVQRGMFSQLSLTGDQICRLRESHALYVTPSGRINVAGLLVTDVPPVIERLLAVGKPALARA